MVYWGEGMCNKIWLFLTIFIVFSCYNEVQDPESPISKVSSSKSFFSFGFTEFECQSNINNISGNITVYLPAGTDTSEKSSLTPVFSHNAYTLTSSAVTIYSGHSTCDFSSDITMKLYAADNTYKDYTISVQIAASAPTAPTASSISVSGTFKTGELLTGNYTYSDLNNDSENGTNFKWFVADDNSGTNQTEISGQTSQTFTPDLSYNSKYIAFAVQPANNETYGDTASWYTSVWYEITSTIDRTGLTITEWADAGTNVDYIEITNFSGTSISIDDSNFAIVFDGNDVKLNKYYTNNGTTEIETDFTGGSVTIAAGEIFIIVDSDVVTNSSLSTIRSFIIDDGHGGNTSTGNNVKVFLSNETTLIGSTDRLDDQQVYLKYDTDTWSYTPYPFTSGTSTYSWLRNTFIWGTNSTDDNAYWANGSSGSRTPGGSNNP